MSPTAADCTRATIIGFLLPFFLAGAGGNPACAEAAIRTLVDTYNAQTPAQLDLVGRIIGFSITAMDNLRLSATPGLSDTKLLRYRTNAVTLGRSSDQARTLLAALQAGQEIKRDVPRPTVAAAPPAPKTPAIRPATVVNVPIAAHKGAIADVFAGPIDIEAMKRDARTMMDAFSKHGGQASSLLMTPDPVAMSGAAAHAAVRDAMRRQARGPGAL